MANKYFIQNSFCDGKSPFGNCDVINTEKISSFVLIISILANCKQKQNVKKISFKIAVGKQKNSVVP